MGLRGKQVVFCLELTIDFRDLYLDTGIFGCKQDDSSCVILAGKARSLFACKRYVDSLNVLVMYLLYTVLVVTVK